MSRFGQWLRREGSTRPAALMRIGLALLVWTRFAAGVAPWNLQTPMTHASALLFYAASAAMLVGWYSRTATAITGFILLRMVYVMGPAGMEPWTHHHTTLLAHGTALLALTPCGGSYSVDRWLALNQAERDGVPAPPERAEVWAVSLIAVQLTVLYLSATLDKLTPAFLSGERLQHSFMLLYQGADPVTLPGFVPLCAFLAMLTVVLELAIPIGMWFRRFQPPLIALGFAMHAAFYILLPVGTFSLTTLLLYLAWLDPDEVHAFLDRLGGAALPPDA